MTLIWHGSGLIVPVVGFGFLIAGQLSVDALFHEGYWKSHDWPLLLAGVLTAVVLWFVGRRLNGSLDRRWVDSHSGVELIERPARHSFFFIPVEWAGVLLGGWPLLFALVRG